MAAALCFAVPPLPMQCPKCEDAELATEWGCNGAEVTRPPEGVAWFGCFRCDPEDPDRDCPTCGGKGMWWPPVCPWRYVRHRSLEVCRSLGFMEKGFLPSPGGYMQQAHCWIRSVEIVAREREEYEKERRRREASAAKGRSR